MPYGAELRAHCYRMLGSIDDADDALQEALLRAWRGLPRFAGRRLLRPWLYKIATNACLDLLGRRAKRVHPLEAGPPAGPDVDAPQGPRRESSWVEPYPDERLGVGEGYATPEARYEQREAVELAFIAALQHLPARQRAALILRDVLGFSASEVAEALESTPASVNSALQRARKAVRDRVPERTQQATLRSLGDERLHDIVQRYIHAWERGDVDAIIALLAEDATIAMPPWATWWRGREVIAGFVRRDGGDQWRLVPTRASGQFGSRPVPLGRPEARLRAGRARGARPRGRPHQAHHGLCDTRDLPSLRPAGRTPLVGAYRSLVGREHGGRSGPPEVVSAAAHATSERLRSGAQDARCGRCDARSHETSEHAGLEVRLMS